MEAIIYKIINYKNKDRLAYFISDMGYLCAILKNAQSYKSDNFLIREYMLCDIEISSIKNSINKLDKIKIISEYNNLKNDFDSLKKIMIIFKITTDLIKDKVDAIIVFKLLKKLLKKYNNEIYFYLYLVKITYFLGIRIDNYIIENDIVDINLKNNLLYLYNVKIDELDENKKIEIEKIKNYIKSYYHDLLSYKIIGI